MASVEFIKDRPMLPWERKFGNIDTKLAVIGFGQKSCIKRGFSRMHNLMASIKFNVFIVKPA